MAALDDFAAASGGLLTPATHAAAVTKSDTVDLTHVSRGLYLGTSGDVAAITLSDETITFTGLAAGICHPLRLKRVLSTNTTATFMVEVW